MAKQTGTLEYRKGWLCVAITSVCWAEPIIYTHYFPIREVSEHESKQFVLGDHLVSFNPNVFVSITHRSIFPLRTAPFEDGTYAVEVEELPYPKPRGKHNWKDGEWRKAR